MGEGGGSGGVGTGRGGGGGCNNSDSNPARSSAFNSFRNTLCLGLNLRLSMVFQADGKETRGGIYIYISHLHYEVHAGHFSLYLFARDQRKMVADFQIRSCA